MGADFSSLRARSRQGTGLPRDPRALDLTAAIRILRHAGRMDALQFADETERLQFIVDELCDLSVHDGLTGLVNATFFREVLAREVDRSARTGRTCGLLIVDIDHFKNVNDTHGHQVGDVVLQAVAGQMIRSLRNMDTAARVGGEEFAVILPECAPEDAILAATRIHSALNPVKLAIDKVSLSVNSSAGLVWTDAQHAVSYPILLAQGDAQMYRAKKAGRGRLCYPARTSAEISAEERLALTSVPPESESKS